MLTNYVCPIPNKVTSEVPGGRTSMHLFIFFEGGYNSSHTNIRQSPKTKDHFIQNIDSSVLLLRNPGVRQNMKQGND